MREVEVLIAGAGPAGSTCAFELQKAGRACFTTALEWLWSNLFPIAGTSQSAF